MPQMSVHAERHEITDVQMTRGVVSVHEVMKLDSEMDGTIHWRSCCWGVLIMPRSRVSKITITAILHLDYQSLFPIEDVRPAALRRVLAMAVIARLDTVMSSSI